MALNRIVVVLMVSAASLIAPISPVATSAYAAQSYDSCAGFIDSLPATITTQGTWCLRGDLATSVTSGNAITIATNNVTIDCMGNRRTLLHCTQTAVGSTAGSEALLYLRAHVRRRRHGTLPRLPRPDLLAMLLA